MRVWDVSRTLTEPTGQRAASIAYSPDGSFSPRRANEAPSFATPRRRAGEAPGHDDSARSVACSEDGSLLVAGFADGTVEFSRPTGGSAWAGHSTPTGES